MRVLYCTAAAFALFVGFALMSAGAEQLDKPWKDNLRLAVGFVSSLIGLGTLAVILWG